MPLAHLGTNSSQLVYRSDRLSMLFNNCRDRVLVHNLCARRRLYRYDVLVERRDDAGELDAVDEENPYRCLVRDHRTQELILQIGRRLIHGGTSMKAIFLEYATSGCVRVDRAFASRL